MVHVKGYGADLTREGMSNGVALICVNFSNVKEVQLVR